MENKLNIQITVTDEQMCSLLRGSLESLPDEKVQDIFANALTEFFKTNNGQKMFYTSNGYYDNSPKPTPLLTKMVENAVSKELLKPYVDELVVTLKDNYTNLLKSAMLETFSRMFFTEVQQSYLQHALNEMIAKIDCKEDKR